MMKMICLLLYNSLNSFPYVDMFVILMKRFYVNIYFLTKRCDHAGFCVELSAI